MNVAREARMAGTTIPMSELPKAAIDREPVAGFRIA
jgi:hypothetical protein